MNTKLWICGQIKCEEHKEWEFQGVFDAEEKAAAACRDAMYFILPVTLNESLPHETTPIEGGYYPLRV